MNEKVRARKKVNVVLYSSIINYDVLQFGIW